MPCCIARLHDCGVASDNPAVNDLYNDIQHALALESADGPFNCKDLFTGGKWQDSRRMPLCLTVDGFSPFSEISLVAYYALLIFQSSRFKCCFARLTGCVHATAYLLASIMSIFTNEKI